MSTELLAVEAGILLRSLPRRQHQVLQLLLLDGLSEKEAARVLGISRHTVHVYVKCLYRRFAVHSKAELYAALYGGTAPPIDNNDAARHWYTVAVACARLLSSRRVIRSMGLYRGSRQSEERGTSQGVRPRPHLVRARAPEVTGRSKGSCLLHISKPLVK
jgi:DNA-binding CsgD family transcriptional regulator